MARAPVADWLDPDAWPPLIARLKIIIGVELALALHQAKALGLTVVEHRDLQFSRIGERAPDHLAIAHQHAKAIRIMNFRPIVVDPAAVSEAVMEHRGDRSDANLADLFARIDDGAHV